MLRPDPGLELAVTTDLLVEGRHFLPQADPEALGHKVLAVNLSDLAAMGAVPRWVTLSLGLPSADEAWLARFAAGFFSLAERYAVDLVGGDTTRSPQLSISVTALGELPAGLALYRAAARPGDDVWVSGELGAASLALVLPEIPDAARRLHKPEPRVELGLRLRNVAHAAIDVSDGLAGDLQHILDRSGVGGVVNYVEVPRPVTFRTLNNPRLEQDCVLSGGDDYELVFTAPVDRRAAVETLSRELNLPLTRIGSIHAGEPRLAVLDAEGKAMKVRPGFDHFRA